jgi:glycosyltransferase involved in cell wall biosynthesis
MYKGKKVVVVLPAYNAAKTLEQTYREIPFDLVDEVILCDDHSRDNTAELARSTPVSDMLSFTKRTKVTAETRNHCITNRSRSALIS